MEARGRQARPTHQNRRHQLVEDAQAGRLATNAGLLRLGGHQVAVQRCWVVSGVAETRARGTRL
jgi:hypothetical protein